jgi:hypothetical protein
MSPDEVRACYRLYAAYYMSCGLVPTEEYWHLFMRSCAISFSRNRSRKLLGLNSTHKSGGGTAGPCLVHCHPGIEISSSESIAMVMPKRVKRIALTQLLVAQLCLALAF